MNIIAETDRLLIREFIESDIEEILLLHSDPRILEFTGDIVMTRTDEAENVLNNIITNQYQKTGMGRWAVHEKKSGRMLGWCGLRKQNNEIDLGIRFKKKFWNKGYGTESSKAILNKGFVDLKIPEVIARTAKENHGMNRILLNLGFEKIEEKKIHGIGAFIYKLEKNKFSLTQ